MDVFFDRWYHWSALMGFVVRFHQEYEQTRLLWLASCASFTSGKWSLHPSSNTKPADDFPPRVNFCLLIACLQRPLDRLSHVGYAENARWLLRGGLRNRSLLTLSKALLIPRLALEA
jgi:hypothetical protein